MSAGAAVPGEAVDAGEARALLVDLVGTPSVSGDEDACAALLVDFFETHGREVWTDAVGNVHAPGADGVLLTSHLDTVPGEIPVRVEETDAGDVLWGRGSVDAKGPLAAMAVAAVETGASFLGVVGEETDSRGARYAVETMDEPDAVVNGEPSGWDAVTLGYRGLLAGTYTAETESVHSSRPEPNAIQQAVDWCGRVETALAPADEKETFESVTWTPTAIDGGVANDGHAVEATADVQLRVPPGTSLAAVREQVEAELDDGSVEWTEAIEPVQASPRTPVARAFRVAIREQDGEPTLLRKTGTSDMNVFATAWDCPMLTYGPGDSELDHTPNEHLLLSEFDRAVAVLTEATATLLEP